MPDTRPSFEQLADTARRALARGDRDSARASLIAAIRTPDAEGIDRSESCESLLRLGALYQEAGLDEEAERLFGDAVAIAEHTLGDEHPALPAALSALGSRLVARGANEKAEPLLRRALTISERQLGANHPDLNSLLNVLSRLYLKQGAFAGAEPLLDRLLELKRAKGEEHPEVATVLASLALVRQGLGDHEGGEQLGRRVLQIREKTLAPNHYAIASALEFLADECAARGKVEEAGRLYQRALSIREQTLGVSHASLRVLRERIVDLQMQAADLAGDDDAGAIIPLPPMPYPIAAPVPAARAPASLPASATASLPPTLSIAERVDEPQLPSVRSPARATIDPNEVEEREERQQALVLPASTGLLSLQEELQIIESEMQDEAAASTVGARARAMIASISAALSTRRAQAIVAGTTVVVLLLAALSTQPRAAESGSARAEPALGAGQPRVGKPASSALAADGDSSSPYVRTSAGSIAQHAASATGSPTVASHEAGSRPTKETSRKEGDDVRTLELSRNLRLPVPSVSVGQADSVARATEQGANPAEGFTKQFWTSGIDKRASESSTGPTSARLIGPMPEPEYPVFLRKNNVEGEVVVQFVVDETGKPDMSTLEVVRSPHDAMTASVRKVIGQLRFEPARTGGVTPKPRTEVVRSSFLFKAGGK